MKNKKQTIGLLVGLVCVVLLIVLLLTMCKGPASEPAPTEPPQSMTVPTEAEKPTEEATEPPTEPEEETEPTEEPTEPVSSGNSRPGGTSGPSFSGSSGNTNTDTDTDTDTDAKEETVTVSDPGTQGNPYTETLADLPDSIGTVVIPAGSAMYYHLYNVDGLVLTIEDKNATVIYNEATYTADDNGVVTVELASAEAETLTPVVLQISSSVHASYLMNFAEHLGGVTNPEILESLEKIEVTLEEGDQNGYYYQWTATETGTVTFAVDGVEPVEFGCDIILTNGETAVKMSESGVADEMGRMTVSIDMAEDDEISIQVVATPEGEGSYPAEKITISGAVALAYGTEENPWVVSVDQIPGTITTDIIDAVAYDYYQVYGIGGTMITVEDPDVFIIYNGVTYGANAGGTVTVPIADQGPRTPASFQIGNGGTAAESYTIKIAYPVGSQMNPAELVLGENTASVEAGDADGYYFTWTATERGTLTVAMDPEASWFYAMANTTTGVAGDNHWSDDDPQATSDSLTVHKGDQIQVVVNTYNPEDMWSNPAGDVVFTASFTADAGTAGNPITVMGEFPIVTPVIAPKDEVYYSVYGAGGLILSIADPDAYAIVNDVKYTAVEGVVTVEVVSENPRMPVSLAIGNSGASAESYTVNMTIPLGDSQNPAALALGENTAALKAGDADGYFFTWTAPYDGTLTIIMPGEGGWSYWAQNTNSGFMTDAYCSDDETVVTSVTLDVCINDVIIVNVSTYDPADPWNAPAGNVVFGAEFAQSEDGVTYTVHVTDYDDEPVGNASVKFVLDGVVAAEQVANANGVVAVKLPIGEYTVVVEAAALYHEDDIVVDEQNVTAEVKMAPAAGEETMDVRYRGAAYTATIVSVGGTYVELAEGANYFVFIPEEAGDYTFTTSDFNAKLGYWGNNISNLSSSYTSKYVNSETNTMEIPLNDSAVGRYFVLSVTSEAETSCILEILLPDEKGIATANETVGDATEIPAEEPAVPAADTVGTVSEVTESVTTEAKPEETVPEAVEPPEESVVEPTEETVTESAEVTEPTEETQPVAASEELPAEETQSVTAPPVEETQTEEQATEVPVKEASAEPTVEPAASAETASITEPSEES